MIHARIPSAVGDLLAVSDGQSLTELSFDALRARQGPGRGAPGEFVELRAQLSAYFAGELRDFTLALAPAGPAFEQRVWGALRTIPYGTTTSYGAIARQLGLPNAARAVGLANARNPIAIVIPCHRVIGADGSLTGYGGGLARKRQLLELESCHSGLFEATLSQRG
ncbi:MAG: methylated-DNA--[protein]-cysteine S-methyltransferase [Gemmatimonadaceae bacterium]